MGRWVDILHGSHGCLIFLSCPSGFYTVRRELSSGFCSSAAPCCTVQVAFIETLPGIDCAVGLLTFFCKGHPPLNTFPHLEVIALQPLHDTWMNTSAGSQPCRPFARTSQGASLALATQQNRRQDCQNSRWSHHQVRRMGSSFR